MTTERNNHTDRAVAHAETRNAAGEKEGEKRMYALLSEICTCLLNGGYIRLPQIAKNGVHILYKRTRPDTKLIAICDCTENKVACKEDLEQVEKRVRMQLSEAVSILFVIYGFRFSCGTMENILFINAETGLLHARRVVPLYKKEQKMIRAYAGKERERLLAYQCKERHDSDIFMIAIMAVNIWLYIMYRTSLSRDYGITASIKETGELYRYLTYMFLHGSLLHLISNMISLWIFGKKVIRTSGTGMFLYIYLLGGIGGGIVSSLWKSVCGITANTVGASGAIFALLGAYVASALADPDSGLHMTHTLKYAAMVFFMSCDRNADIACHAGGMICGFVIAFFVISRRSFVGRIHGMKYKEKVCRLAIEKPLY